MVLCPTCKKPLNRCKCKLEDMAVRIGSKEEAAWKDIHDKTVQDIALSKRTIELGTVILEFCERKMEEERAKFNAQDL
jgi:hypothetical protein